MRRAMTVLVTMATTTGMLWATAAPSTAGGGCSGGPPGAGSGTTVKMDQNCFYPAVLFTDPGARVTWINSEPVAHTVTGVGVTWGSYDGLAGGSRASYDFAEDGVYVYSCIIHPGMVGAVVVGDGIGAGGLEPASVEAVLPGSGSNTGAATGDGMEAASVDATTGDGWVRAAAAVAAGVALGVAVGAIAVVGLLRVRGRRLAASA